MGLFGYFGYQVFWVKGLRILLGDLSVRVKFGFGSDSKTKNLGKYPEERFSFGSSLVILGNSDSSGNLDSTSDILDKISNDYDDSDNNLEYFELFWIFRIKISGYFVII